MGSIGEIRVAAAFQRYAAACAAHGIDVSGWTIEPGRLRPRPEDCRPWRIVGGASAPGFRPNGELGPEASSACARLVMAARVLRDLRAV